MNHSVSISTRQLSLILALLVSLPSSLYAAESVNPTTQEPEIGEPVPEKVIEEKAESTAKRVEEAAAKASQEGKAQVVKQEEKITKVVVETTTTKKVEEPKTEEKTAATAPTVEKKWYDYFTLQPFLVLRLRLNFDDLAHPEPMLYRAGVRTIASFEPFDLVFEPHFGQVKARDFHTSNVAIAQALVRWHTPVEGLSVAGGILFNQFGYFWDDSFFGNVLAYQGRKIDPDYNVELAYDNQFGDNFGFAGWLQLGLGMDSNNISLTLPGRENLLTANDFESDPNFKEGLAARARVLPRFTFGDFLIMPGFSIEMQVTERLEHTHNTKKVEAGTGNVISYGADLTLAWRNYKLLGEYVGVLVPGELSYDGKAIQRHYITASATIPFYQTKESDWFSYNAIIGGYHLGLFQRENLKESIIRAGLTSTIYKYLSVQAEYVRWELDKAPQPTTHALELALQVHFY